MREMSMQGVRRGKVLKITISNKANPCPVDRVNRQLRASRSNVLWGEMEKRMIRWIILPQNDFTYVAAWQGCVHTAFVIAFAQRIVDWRVTCVAHADFVLDALKQALHKRRPVQCGGLAYCGDQGNQYVSIQYTERLVEVGSEQSLGSVGDSYDNVLAEIVICLYKTEVIRRLGLWRSLEAVEFATVDSTTWFNTRRLLEPIGNIPSVEVKECYYAEFNEVVLAA